MEVKTQTHSKGLAVDAAHWSFEVLGSEWRGCALGAGTITGLIGIMYAVDEYTFATGSTAFIAGVFLARNYVQTRRKSQCNDAAELDTVLPPLSFVGWWNAACDLAGISPPPAIVTKPDGTPDVEDAEVDYEEGKTDQHGRTIWMTCPRQITFDVLCAFPKVLTVERFVGLGGALRQAIGAYNVTLTPSQDNGQRVTVHVKMARPRPIPLGPLPTAAEFTADDEDYPEVAAHEPSPATAYDRHMPSETPAYSAVEPTHLPERGESGSEDLEVPDHVPPEWTAHGSMPAPTGAPVLLIQPPAPVIEDDRPHDAKHGTGAGTVWEILGASPDGHSSAWLAGRAEMTQKSVSNILSGWERRGLVARVGNVWRRVN